MCRSSARKPYSFILGARAPSGVSPLVRGTFVESGGSDAWRGVLRPGPGRRRWARHQPPLGSRVEAPVAQPSPLWGSLHPGARQNGTSSSHRLIRSAHVDARHQRRRTPRHTAPPSLRQTRHCGPCSLGARPRVGAVPHVWRGVLWPALAAWTLLHPIVRRIDASTRVSLLGHRSPRTSSPRGCFFCHHSRCNHPARPPPTCKAHAAGTLTSGHANHADCHPQSRSIDAQLRR
mmetsp:Transcript_23001/g.74026  ORF Transcript_23001/g.74026 Transcript_23001/m.74026 type:complete len:233 (+) Transcript_23001:155-853(+)